MLREAMVSQNVRSREIGVGDALSAPTGFLDLANLALRCALREPTEKGATDHEIRAVLCRLCDTAHARGLLAEQVIVLLKQAWRDLPEARRAAREHELTALSLVVTLCIDEYYVPLASAVTER